MNLLKSFRVKVTLILVFSMLFACLASDLVIYQYALERQFQELRNRLMIVARISALMIDGDLLSTIGLTKAGATEPAYKEIADKLLEIKLAVPSITYIYTLTKSAKPGIFNFIVDPEPKGEDAEDPGAYPGEEYDAANFPELSRGWDGPAADKKLGRDEWGVFMSGYAPVKNRLEYRGYTRNRHVCRRCEGYGARSGQTRSEYTYFCHSIFNTSRSFYIFEGGLSRIEACPGYAPYSKRRARLQDAGFRR